VIRFVLGSLAYFLLAAAFAIGIVDATTSIEREALLLTPFAQMAILLHPTQPGAFEAYLKDHVPGLLWDPVLLELLRLPAVLVLALTALILFRLARQRPRKIGFEI
jgi:hypothetical protein